MIDLEQIIDTLKPIGKSCWSQTYADQLVIAESTMQPLLNRFKGISRDEFSELVHEIKAGLDTDTSNEYRYTINLFIIPAIVAAFGFKSEDVIHKSISDAIYYGKKIHYPGDMRQCPECGAQFLNQGGLTAHTRAKHSGVIIPGQITKDELVRLILIKLIPGGHNKLLDIPYYESRDWVILVGSHLGYRPSVNVSNEFVREFAKKSVIEYGIWNPGPLTQSYPCIRSTKETMALATASHLSAQNWLAIKTLLCQPEIDWDAVEVTANLLQTQEKSQ